MQALLGMPQGSEWLIILAIIVLLFGSAKLPGLVRSLGQSKKAWDDEVTTGKDKKGELTQNTATPAEQPVQPVQQPVQQPAQPVQQPVQPVQQPVQQQTQQPVQQPNPQVNGQRPGDGTPPTQSN